MMMVQSEKDEGLTSEGLASFVIDALLRAGFVREVDVEDALAVAAEEIHVRNLSGELVFPR